MNISSAVLFLPLCAALLAGAGSARAAEGRIAFSGAVVEPTCAVAQPGADLAGASAAPTRQSCGKTASNPGRVYTRTVRPVDEASAGGDRLLTYFARNASLEQGPGQARLVVRTYD